MPYVGRRAAGGTTTGSTGYGSPAPSTGYPGTGTQRSTRLAASDYNQSARPSPMPRQQTPSAEADEDGEGEEDDGNEEDKNLYCFCQKLSYGTVGIRSSQCQCAWLTMDFPQMVGCDDDQCQFQWVMFTPVLHCVPLVVLISLSSSMWGVLVLKIPRRVVGTVLRALPDAVRNTQEGHQGKEGRRTLERLTESPFGPLPVVPGSYPLYQLITTPLLPVQDVARRVTNTNTCTRSGTEGWKGHVQTHEQQRRHRETIHEVSEIHGHNLTGLILGIAVSEGLGERSLSTL